MTKNVSKEKDDARNETEKNSSFLSFGCIILLICMGLCLSYDLHKTKQISSEILPQMQADYEAQISELNAQIEFLKRDFNKLKTESLSADALSEEYINEKLSEFKNDVLNMAPQNSEEQILQNNAKITALEKAIADLQNKNHLMPQEILLSAGALTIRNMAENGENFAYEAEVLQLMAQGNQTAEQYVSEIRKFSAEPLNTKTSLINKFKSIYADLSGTEIKDEPKTEDLTNAESWKNAFFTRLKNLVTFKHKKTIKFEPAPDEIYILVENGNLAQALAEIKTSQKYTSLNSSALNIWMQNVQNYLDFNKAVNGLLLNSLAGLHLKQFERDYQ